MSEKAAAEQKKQTKTLQKVRRIIAQDHFKRFKQSLGPWGAKYKEIGVPEDFCLVKTL